MQGRVAHHSGSSSRNCLDVHSTWPGLPCVGKGTTAPHGAVTESLHTHRFWSGFQTSRVFANLTIRLWSRSSNSKRFCCGDTLRAASKHARPAPQAPVPGPISLLRYIALTLICTHAHARIHPPTPPSHVHKPGRFPFVLVLRPSGSPLPWPLSSRVPQACLFLLPLCLAAPWERRASRGGVTSASHEGWVMGEGWDCRAGLRPAPCLFSLSPLNARLRCKDYLGRIMPGVNTQANKSACTTRQPRWDPGRGLGERTRSSLLITNK